MFSLFAKINCLVKPLKPRFACMNVPSQHRRTRSHLITTAVAWFLKPVYKEERTWGGGGIVQSGSGCRGGFCSGGSKSPLWACQAGGLQPWKGFLSLQNPSWALFPHFILLIKFFPNWIILGFLACRTLFLALFFMWVLEERGSFCY